MTGGQRAAAAALVALYVGLSLASLPWHSATFDETAHLPAGYTYWRTGDFRLNPEHPPLVKLLAAAPLLAMDVRVAEGDDAWAHRRQWEFGRRFLYQWNDGRRLLSLARVPIIVLGTALGIAVFVETRRRAGSVAALVALLLCATSPDLLAHGHLVTTDVAMALLSFLTVAAFERAWIRTTTLRIAVLGVTLGAALASKFSALLLLPILVLLGAAAVATPTPDEGRTGERLRRAAGLLLAAGAVAFAVLWASYGFHRSLSPDPAVVEAFDWNRVAARSGALAPVAAIARQWRLLPEAYLFGLQRVVGASEHRRSFLLGEVSEDGWWYYFLVTFAVKTPVPLLALLLVGLLWRREPRDRRRAVWLWVPVAVFAGAALTSRLNIGHRHLLPLYPFLFVAAGDTAARLLERRGFTRAATGLLLAWYAAGTLRLHPHYLAYFNELAGGPERGYQVLVDSNLDWGQDLPSLAAYVEKAGRPPLKLSYFGTAEPSRYGVACDLLPGYIQGREAAGTVRRGDLVAVSVTNLQGIYLDPDDPFLASLRAQKPIGRVGHSILIYRASSDTTMRGAPGGESPP